MPGYDIRPFPLRTASQDDYACLADFENILRREHLPDDPPIPCAEAVQRWQAMPAYVEEAAWAAWDDPQRRIAAFGEAQIFHTGDNQHQLEFHIAVLPECRRQGLARQLLRRVVEQARSLERRLLITEVMGDIPASEAFLRGIGARKGLEARQNQLRLADLDRGLIPAWLARANTLSGEYRLGWWQGFYPEDRIQELADMLQIVANDEPRGTLEREDFNFTADVIRQYERRMLAGGQQRWVLYVTDRAHDRLLGLTEVLWHPDRPAILFQGFTGVVPEQRRKGLGRWLKAAMLDRVLRERPEVEVVRTGNADSNVPMLKINTELGFKPYITACVWQVERAAVESYLAARD